MEQSVWSVPRRSVTVSCIKWKYEKWACLEKCHGAKEILVPKSWGRLGNDKVSTRLFGKFRRIWFSIKMQNKTASHLSVRNSVSFYWVISKLSLYKAVVIAIDRQKCGGVEFASFKLFLLSISALSSLPSADWSLSVWRFKLPPPVQRHAC